VTIDWAAKLSFKTITGRPFQADNVFHQVVARVHKEIALLLREPEAKKILIDPCELDLTDFPSHRREQVNVDTFHLGPISDRLRERLPDAVSLVIAFWRDCGRLWSNALFFEVLPIIQDVEDDLQWACIVAACLLCLDRALVHGDRGHVREAEDWFDCAQWLRFSLDMGGLIGRTNMIAILAGYLQLDAEARSQRARQLNELRHTKTRDAREKIVCDWEKDPSRFRSAAKAGIYYSDWLADQGYHFEPRTVTDWIRAHAKAIDRKLR
jgi:hypothetical protein